MLLVLEIAAGIVLGYFVLAILGAMASDDEDVSGCGCGLVALLVVAGLVWFFFF